MTLEQKLTSELLQMMAEKFDRDFPGSDNESARRLTECAHVTAKFISKRLITEFPKGTTDSAAWRCAVERATSGAVLKLPDGTGEKNLGENASFVSAVYRATGLVVAPEGSQWRRELEDYAEKKMRASLAKWGISGKKLDTAVKEWKASTAAVPRPFST